MIQNLSILILIIIYTLLIAYLLNAFLNFRLKKLAINNDSTLGISLVKATLLVVAGLLLSELPASIVTLTDTLSRQNSGIEFYQEAVQYTSLFVGIVFLLLVMIYFIASGLLSLLSKESQFKIEVANNNKEKLMIFIGIAVLLTFSIKTFLPSLLDYFIPYQTIPIIN